MVALPQILEQPHRLIVCSVVDGHARLTENCLSTLGIVGMLRGECSSGVRSVMLVEERETQLRMDAWRLFLGEKNLPVQFRCFLKSSLLVQRLRKQRLGIG